MNRHDATDNVALLARLCLWAGILGAASGVFLAVYPPDVDSSRFSYPLTATAFVAIQVWFAVHHLGLLAGIEAVRRLNPGPPKLGIWLALAGLAMLAAMELLAISAADSPYPGPRTDLLDAGYGISSTVIGIGLVWGGIAISRSQLRSGWHRWLVLATGVYVFVPMFPAMFSGFLAARLAITGWMLLFAVLGWSLARTYGATGGRSIGSDSPTGFPEPL